ncbi:XRE family transcriptional regulator [Lacrimispora amygdalina]|uniref:XRE family transcriptional regulator n=1 Tax=Lacrimispora amygdalina TaxID=253257 RepID=A0A3E2N978_9FIRM|nr:helix-turn-helix transcriptional regulator [Clostridium indicum]RFZ77480.1 XRE family transcriptional regulator [Clostridium indicum]
MNDLLKEIGKRIYDRRKQMNLTQEVLAERTNVTPQTISTAELGRKAMRPDTIIRLCDALEISTDYLLRGNITQSDNGPLVQKFSDLTPSQYRHLEDIINSYIAAIKESEA